MKSCIYFVFMLCTFNVMSQNFTQGTVINIETKKVIIGAVIVNKSLGIQTISNDSGYFKIAFNNTDTLLSKHVAYIDSYLDISKIESQVDKYFYLTPKFSLLNVVEVNSDEIKVVIDKKNENIIDYIFYENEIITITKIKSNYRLSLMNAKVVFDLPLGKPKSFYIDCYENIHILSKDSSFQIFLNEKFQFP